MSAQELLHFKNKEEFRAWVVENKNKLWEYCEATPLSQRSKWNNSFPQAGQIYMSPTKDAYENSNETLNLFFINALRYKEDTGHGHGHYIINYYFCNLVKTQYRNWPLSSKKELVVGQWFGGNEYWNTYFKQLTHLFLYNPSSLQFLNWNQDPFEVKS